MSASRRRREARAWLHKERAKREELRKDFEKRISDARKEEHERLTFMIAPDDDGTVLPQGKPQYPYLRIPARVEPGGYLERMLNMSDLRYYERCRIFHLRATQHALVLPDGTKVVWYGWEHRG